ncbi:MAG: VOC family protein [Ferrovibrio sp.]|uniref:VOC family protein n=1 Tax=Ferrovibrio sp. TaxID=1917215 RepID=UPI00261AE6C1|nr:VOC family protein [Ferrovibrio sp.]MCW0234013.1 VOC family protein [Ferrovibrio sp.]
MSITGVDGIVYGVEDMALCRRFFRNWGLKEIAEGRFETLDGTEVILRPKDDPVLAPAFEAGSTLREGIWGVGDAAALAQIGQKLKAAGMAVSESKDALSCIDPSGLKTSFRVSRRRKVAVTGAPSNTIDQHRRIDTPSPIYQQAEPVNIGHYVLFVPEVEPMQRFYTDVLGFHISDSYPGTGLFLRCSAQGGHHNLFLLKSPTGKAGINHVAFTVRDVHEVIGGGMQINRQGWETQLGPGRHPISSAFFWYVKNPAGGLAEYYTDEDYLTEKWQPREFEKKPEIFAEWAVTGGIDGETRRQKIKA